METNQILFLILGFITGVIAGALFYYFAFGRRSSAEYEERARHDFEKQQIKLETELAHARKDSEETEAKLREAERENDDILKRLSAAETSLSVAGERLSDHNAQRAPFEQKIEKVSQENTALQSEKSRLEANFEALSQKLETEKENIEKMQKKSLLEFENIAAKILETKSEKFTETNRQNIEKLLEPLNKDIVSFKTKVEETYDKESKERFSLDKTVRELIEKTDQVSAEANNLAAALKGQAKTQGNWGEVILERILEVNGLTRGREYDVQHSQKTEDGAQQFLDVIVHLPDERKLIIDSKVSLNAYERYCSAENDEDRERNLKDHIRAITTHIDQLSGKKYDDLDTAADFVMMFVPIEPAYLVAMQSDLELSKKAFAKRVILISQTSLMVALKMVSDLWKRDQQSKNALEIAAQGQKLYDKFVGFLNNMNDVGSHIEKSQDAFTKAFRQLKTGPGNLVSQAEKLKELGIKTSKTLPAVMENFDRDNESGAVIDITGDTK